MAKFSFDIVSDFDKSEMNNVFDQTQRELSSRYDLKNTKAKLEWISNDKEGILVKGENDFQVEAIIDIFRKKIAQRGLSQKILDLSTPPETGSFIITQKIMFKKGIKQDDAKIITKIIKTDFPKVNTQIQGDEIRVIGSKKDELQDIISLLKQTDLEFPLSFTNYR
jgi:uncharacterized protein YajQ (UPF0234 family)